MEFAASMASMASMVCRHFHTPDVLLSLLIATLWLMLACEYALECCYGKHPFHSEIL